MHAQLHLALVALLTAISTSVLTTAAPLRRANSQDLFSSACDSAGLAGQLTGVAITALNNIQSNDQNVNDQLDELKSILAAVDTAGSQVGADCQAAGLGLNSNNNSNSQNNSQTSNQDKSQNPSTSQNSSTTTTNADAEKTQSK